MNKILSSDKNQIFSSSYDYGQKEQQIVRQNAIISFLQTTIVRPFKSMIYSGSSFLKERFIDSEREKKAKDQLLTIGGESVKMRTPDGDIIDGMYLSTNRFKKGLQKYFHVIESENKDGTIKQKLIIKSEFCKEEERQLNSGETSIYLKPNEEAQSFFDKIKGLGFSAFPNTIIGSEEDKKRGLCIELGNIPKNLPVADDQANSYPTVLISPGADMSYPAYKGLAVAYLLRGINVMMIDFRGYGESQGSPTSHKTKLDLETAYQYLATKHGVENKDLIVHGHCMGGGPATDLAARRKGVNLILDRSFAEYRDVARNRFPLMSSIIYKIMPWIVNYNNTKNLGQVEGHIAIEMAKEDAVISESQIIKQIDGLSDTKKGQIIKLMDSPGGHGGLWTDEVITSLQFNQFLEQINLRKRLF